MEKVAAALALLEEALDEVQASTRHVGTEELGDDVVQAQRVIGAVTAVQTTRIAQYAARDERRLETGEFVEEDRGIGHVAEFAADLLAPALGMSHGTAQKRVHLAVVQAARLPGTMAALAAGDLDPFRAQIVAEELAGASRDTCRRVEDELFPAVHGDTPARVRKRVRRILSVVDGEALRAKAARARLQRFVHTRAADVPGMTEWFAQLPTEDSVKCWAAIDELAHQAKQDDPSRTIDQCRADALVDLLLGRATVTATVNVMVPVETLTVQESAASVEDAMVEEYLERHAGPGHQCRPGADRPTPAPGTGQWGADGEPAPAPGTGQWGADGEPAPPGPGPGARGPGEPTSFNAFGAPVEQAPAEGPAWQQVGVHGFEVPGVGVIPSHAMASICASFDTDITRVLVDARTGVVLETGVDRYRPSRAIRRMTQRRDGTCRFPGCAVRAERCEPDHVVRYPDGPTAVWNLVSLCKHHHRVKHETRWRLTMTGDGVCTWTDPFSRQYATRPVDHYELSVA